MSRSSRGSFPVLAKVQKALNNREPLTISGLGSATAKTYLLSQLETFTHPDRVILWCPKTEAEGRQIEHLLSYWEAITPLTITDESLTTVLHTFITGQACFCILPIDRMRETIIAPRRFEEAIVTLHTGDQITPAAVVKRLLNAGYERNANATTPGEFAVHGNIVDVVPVDASHIVRVECGPSTIESVRLVRLSTGKEIRRVVTVDVIPFKIVTTRQSTNWLRYLQRLSSGSVVIMSDPDTYADEQNWDEIAETVERLTPLTFNTLRSDDEELVVSSRSPLFYHGALDQWVKAVAKRKSDTVIVLTEREKEVRRWWKEYAPKSAGAFPATIKPATANDMAALEGFQIEDLKLVCWTDRELFGSRQPAGEASKKIDTTFLAELTAGDFVVHLDHGVGKFVGMTSNTVDGIEREYFRLEYAEGDKLLVPTEMAYKLDKYIGATHPQLHRLNSASWSQMTKKVREDTKALAKDLLKIYALREKSTVEAFGAVTPLEQELAASFKHDETPDQLRTIAEIDEDLQRTRPMDRLICGDVGFGKTEVAIRAAFKAVANGYQVAVLAPTTILVQQHFDTFSERLKNFDVIVESLSRFRTDKEQRDIVEGIRGGLVNIAIGTHRLLSGDVSFKKLGLIIIDEEQRFGVKDKERLKNLRADAHVLTMSATPIPRTLNFSLSSLRDLSLITTPPQGRQAIETIIEPYDDDHVTNAIISELKRKGQVYYIHNEVETIQAAARRLSEIVPKASIGIAHGQMHERELAHAMQEFDGGKTNVLVVTTIIENGVDLPNVNTLIVENATKFGLAQLYQLRGRIGRSDRQATAYFFYRSQKLNPEAKKRLKALLEAKELGSGFQLALRDLEIRGIGNILGKEQHGQVTVIGLSLYTRLLNQAIEELKHNGAHTAYHDVSIDLPLDIRVPTTFIPNERKRLRVYQQLTNVTDLAALKEFREDLTQQYGGFPENVANLFDQMEMKILAQQTLITSIGTTTAVSGEKRVVITVSQFEPESLKRVLDDFPGWTIGEGTIKTDLSGLGVSWKTQLKKTIRHLKSSKPQTDEPPSA